jgi:hypothetical protein
MSLLPARQKDVDGRDRPGHDMGADVALAMTAGATVAPLGALALARHRFVATLAAVTVE